MNTTLENPNVEPKQRRKASRKHVPSKLEPFADQLLQMEVEDKTIDQMLDWLKERAVTTARGNLSKFLRNKREEREVTEQLDSDKNLYQAVEKWIQENPHPKLEAIIERFKMLVLKLAMKKEAAPEVLKLADKLVGTASRAEYRTRKLVMEEAKHAEWVKCERTRGLEYCLILAKEHPAVADMFRSTFAALKAAQTSPCRTGHHSEGTTVIAA
jgi:hypothetical protein